MIVDPIFYRIPRWRGNRIDQPGTNQQLDVVLPVDNHDGDSVHHRRGANMPCWFLPVVTKVIQGFSFRVCIKFHQLFVCRWTLRKQKHPSSSRLNGCARCRHRFISFSSAWRASPLSVSLGRCIRSVARCANPGNATRWISSVLRSVTSRSFSS